MDEPTAMSAVSLASSAIDVSTGPATPPGWARRARNAGRHAHTGLLAIAVGAFELACWDLVGQVHDEPVWSLLSGGEPSPVLTYATCFGLSMSDNSGLGAAAAVRQIWDLQKWCPGPCPGDPDALWRLVDAIRGGQYLALDFRGRWPVSDVVELSADLSLGWLEEPFHPGDLHLASDVELPGPHAAGEHCYGPFEAAVLIAAGVDVWQPDAVFCGGYANLVAIADQAAEAGASCAPHGGGFVPAVHAAIAGSPICFVEYHLLLEPRRQAHLAEPVLPEPGRARVPVPQRPGWAGPLREGLR